MTDTFLVALQKACEPDNVEHGTILLEQYDLNITEKNLLSQKILLLPESEISLLFFRYVFHSDEKTTCSVLGLTSVRGQIRHIKDWLSLAMRLPASCTISDESMEKACKMALPRYMRQVETSTGSLRPKYSNTFRKKLKEIKAAKRPNNLVLYVMQRVAIFVAILLIGFTTTLVVSAAFREMFFRWVVTTFPEYSAFGVTDSEIVITGENIDDYFEKLKQYKLHDIPEGYRLVNFFQGMPCCSYDYVNDDTETFIEFSAALPDNNTTNLNTEDVEVHNIIFKGEPAFIWTKDEITYLVWKQDGFRFHLITPFDFEETKRIAESVSNE